MSKSTNHEADQTVTFHVSIKEWDDMYDENNKTFWFKYCIILVII
jgi:hypothetical protein